MSRIPAQPYVKPMTFDADSPIKPGCPLCKSNGLLKGGKVLWETELLYVYVFENEAGGLKDCFITPRRHYASITSLPPAWGPELASLYGKLIEKYSIQAHNGYWNEGFAAGQRILGHWHLKIDVAPAEGTYAYGKGIALLRRELNQPLVRLVLDRTGCIDLYAAWRKRLTSSRFVTFMRKHKAHK
jgi:hypothetical protein